MLDPEKAREREMLLKRLRELDQELAENPLSANMNETLTRQ